MSSSSSTTKSEEHLFVFDVEKYAGANISSLHQFTDDELRNRIFQYVNQVLDTGALFDKEHPFAIIDIGCGDGKYTTQLANELPIDHITKLLLDPFGDQSLGIHRMFAHEMCQTFPSNYCDVMICNAVAHLLGHTAQFQAFLSGCQRILKPGGVLFIIMMSPDISFPWGPHAQRTYDEGCDSAAYRWQQEGEGPLHAPTQTHEHAHAHQVTVTHEEVGTRIVVTKTEWLKFIGDRAWSSFQRLSDVELQATVAWIKQRFENEDTIALEPRWILSVVQKKRFPDTQSTPHCSGSNTKAKL